MATQEKLLKSLEILKSLSAPNQTLGNSKNKDKIHHCHVITEAISNSTIKIASNFHTYLSVTIEVFLQLCDDQESDVRMTAEECLNRIIRALSDGNIGKVQIELHKGIKRNGPARSLRAALWRFAQLAHLIRPPKGKPYVVNLFPTLIKVAERHEEQIHETLANSLSRIMKVLGSFASETEIKALLRAFLKNVSNPSAVIRRAAASSILNICLNCRKPYIFITYIINNLLDMLVPVTSDNNQNNNFLILGVMNCIKNLLPHLKQENKSQETKINVGAKKGVETPPPSTDIQLQVYELCLHFISNKDHNIINSSLETLNVLLQNSPNEFKKVLLSPNGINKSKINLVPSPSFSNMRSPSQLSVATNSTSEDIFGESELTETLRPDIEKWIDESKLSVIDLHCVKAREKALSTESKSASLDTFSSDFDAVDYKYSLNIASKSSHDHLDSVTVSDNSSEKSFSYIEDEKQSENQQLQEICVGSYLDRDIPLKHCARLITKSFLLSGHPNTCISDKTVRVSVKSLALSCLSSIVNFYPQIFLFYLDKNYVSAKSSPENISNQQISDVVLFEDHSDPQLRGATRILLASFIRAVLVESFGDYDAWIAEKSVVDNKNRFQIEGLINIFIKGLEDESSSCVRQTLTSLNICLEKIAESSSNSSILPVLEILPQLVYNSYWLVKVSLCELASRLPFITISDITNSNNFQNKIVHNVLFKLLQEDDLRVRSAAADAIVQIIPFLYHAQFQAKENTVTIKAMQYKRLYLSNLRDFCNGKSLSREHFIENMPFPFDKISIEAIDHVEFSLSKIITQLYNFLLTSTSKHFIFGCIETLSLLSNTYPTTVYKKSWNCDLNSAESQNSPTATVDLFNICVHLLSQSVLTYDLTCHLNLLNLTSNLYAGLAFCLLGQKSKSETPTNQNWAMFSNPKFSKLSEHFFGHVMKLLNIFHYVLDEVIPSHPQAKSGLPNLSGSNTLSPIKRHKSDLERRVSISNMSHERDEKDRKDAKASTSVAAFVQSPHYMKFYEILRSAYTNYKVSLESEACEKFLVVLRHTLNAFSVLMEVGSLVEFQGVAEEILGYFRFTFRLEASASVQCVQQLLKCLFGTNLTANINDILKGEDSKKVDSEISGFYYNICQKPYDDVSFCFNSLKDISKVDYDGDSTIMGYLHRKDVLKAAVPSRGLDAVLANYIRIFEPMVIKSLKEFTITSDVKLQCKVLKLLSQLIQLRVNYCLLDSEQIFIGFVLKQFEYIEEGQIPLSHKLIPRIFQFLVQLSYSKQHSKSIIGIPKIIQLCDGLLASGQSPLTHCIPALKPIVEDIFLTRNKSNTADMKELETTREVVLSMLLKLVEYHEVVDLIIIILDDSKYCSDNPEKWSRWSNQVINSILTLLKQNKLGLDGVKALTSLRRLIFALEPSVFQPIDNVIFMLFQENFQVPHQRWLAKILIALLILSPLKEDVVIAKINLLKADFSPNSVFDNVKLTADPLNVMNNASVFQGAIPESIFVNFMFKILSITSKECVEIAVNSEKDNFLVEELCIFLMYCIHIFQSGSHCKIANYAITTLSTKQIEEINKNFLKLINFCPLVSFLWCYFLTLLNYNDRNFWGFGTESSTSINKKIVRTGSVIIFCDYLNEDVLETVQLSWFLNHYIDLIIDCCEEAPVSELISSIHRNSVTSQLLLDVIINKSTIKYNPLYIPKVLKCVENVHLSQIGLLLKLLLPKMLLSGQLSISRLVANLASRKLEIVLTMPLEQVHSQLLREDVLGQVKNLVALKLVKKHEGLASLLNKLCTQYYDISPLEFDQKRSINSQYIKNLKINREWYLNQIKYKSDDSKLNKETAELLSRLDCDELKSFIMDTNTSKLILSNCFRLGVSLIHKNELSEEPAIVKASVDCLLEEIKKVCQRIPEPHQVYNICGRIPVKEEVEFSQKLSEIFSDPNFFNHLYDLIPSTSAFIESIPNLPNSGDISKDNLESVLKFSVICLESLTYLISRGQNVNLSFIDSALNCANLILKLEKVSASLGLDSHISRLCSCVNSLFRIVEYFLKDDEPLPTFPKFGLKENPSDLNIIAAGQTCYQLYILVYWLYKTKTKDLNIPKFIVEPVRSLIITLSRLPLVSSYILVPFKVWKSGWTPEFFGPFQTQIPPLPIELLQEIDILEEFIFRITLLGWTTRQQFEETWMCLLSVLCNYSYGEKDQAEMDEAAHVSGLAVQAITAFLLQTLYIPVPGNKNVSKIIHVSRDAPIQDQSIGITKLKKIHETIENSCVERGYLSKLSNIFNNSNFEKFSNTYSYNQVCVKYLLIATNTSEINENCPISRLCQERVKLLEKSGLDINSCLQFLLDFYTQLFKQQAQTPLRYLHELVRSTVVISDLFTDKTQFRWMLDCFLDLSKSHTLEDELLHQYLIVGICKATAVLTPDLETYEDIKKMLVHYLKSSFLPSRISCLHGLLYILEGCILSNISIGGISDEMQIILPCAVDYVQCNLDPSNLTLKRSQEHINLVWALAFFLIENVDEIHMESTFITNTLQTAFNLLFQQQTTIRLQTALMKTLERLIVVRRNIVEKIEKQIVSLATQKLKDDNPSVSILGIQLLLTYMYTSCTEHFKHSGKSVLVQTNPDHLVQTIEKISAIFEHIKRGYVFEVEILCSVLPVILNDFFSPADVLTKVVGEFLSPQQPHPKLLSRIVFEVFERAIEQKQLPLLQDWVVFSLSSFTQSLSIGMATWCLSCFFISASLNEWLRSFFPYVQTRVGRYEYEDRNMLCIAGSDFYNNLASEKQKETFIENFNKVKDQPDTLFSDLLSSL